MTEIQKNAGLVALIYLEEGIQKTLLFSDLKAGDAVTWWSDSWSRGGHTARGPQTSQRHIDPCSLPQDGHRAKSRQPTLGLRANLVSG